MVAMQHARGHLLDDLARRGGHVDVLAVDVVPHAADEDGDVVRQVEDGGDEGEADEEEEGRVCMDFVSACLLTHAWRLVYIIVEAAVATIGWSDAAGGHVQNANFS